MNKIEVSMYYVAKHWGGARASARTAFADVEPLQAMCRLSANKMSKVLKAHQLKFRLHFGKLCNLFVNRMFNTCLDEVIG